MFLATRSAVIKHVDFDHSECRVFLMAGQSYSDFSELLKSIGDKEASKFVFETICNWYKSKWAFDHDEFEISDLLKICPYELEWGLEKVKKITGIEIDFCGIVEMNEFIGFYDNFLDVPDGEDIQVKQLHKCW